MKRRLSWWRRCSHGCPPAIIVALASLVVIGLPQGAAAVDWADVAGPTAMPAKVIGRHSLGCLKGGAELALDGLGYQVMRPSRSRYYGHPNLIAFVRWLGNEALTQRESGILVGDLAQPRGGPMNSGHASHQSGLDVDVWFLPAPDRPLPVDQRETLSAVSMVTEDGLKVKERWTSGHRALLRTVASHSEVERIFVNAAIKQELCETTGLDRSWLAKIRPWWGHDHHFHVRLACPTGDETCVDQPPPAPGDGCDGELAWWFSSAAQQALIDQKKAPRKAVTITDLPSECEAVYNELSPDFRENN